MADPTPTDRPFAARAQELLDQLTPAERLALLHQHAAPVPRVGLGPFRTGTEGLHGVAWLGTATTFPQPVGLAATWDADLLERVGTVVGTEVRAKHAADPTVSLNVWAPVVNPLRHPRWGRNEEGFSRGPAPHRVPRHRVRPGPARRPPDLLAHGPDAEAPRRLRERDRPQRHQRAAVAPGAARVRAAGVPRPDRGRRGGRRDAVVQPGQRPPEPRRPRAPRRGPRVDAGVAVRRLGRRRTHQPGGRRALLRRPRRGRRRRGPGRRGLVHRPRRRPDPDDRAPDRRPGARAARPGGRRPRRAAPARAAPGDRRAGPRPRPVGVRHRRRPRPARQPRAGPRGGDACGRRPGERRRAAPATRLPRGRRRTPRRPGPHRLVLGHAALHGLDRRGARPGATW